MSRLRQLSREEKEALVRRLEAGERVAALAEEAGVLRKSLYQWRAAYRAMGVAGLNRKRRPKPGGSAAVDPSSADAGPPAARPSLRRHRKNDARRTARRNPRARRPDRASLLDRLPVAGKLLSLARTEAPGARRRGSARSDPEIGAQAPARRLSPHHAKAQGRRPRRQRQARAQAHAGRQFVEPAQGARSPRRPNSWK